MREREEIEGERKEETLGPVAPDEALPEAPGSAAAADDDGAAAAPSAALLGASFSVTVLPLPVDGGAEGVEEARDLLLSRSLRPEFIDSWSS